MYLVLNSIETLFQPEEEMVISCFDADIELIISELTGCISVIFFQSCFIKDEIHGYKCVCLNCILKYCCRKLVHNECEIFVQ